MRHEFADASVTFPHRTPMNSKTDPTAQQAVRLDELEQVFLRENARREQEEQARQAAAAQLERALAAAPEAPVKRSAPQNDWIGVPPQHWRAPHPIGSTLPGPLTEDEMPPGVQPDPRPRSRQAVADVPRLPQGVVLQWPVRFHAAGRDYARLWGANVLLLLLTGGLAWPWVVQRREQFFLRNTRVAGHALDYRLEAVSLWPRFAMSLALLLGVAGAALGNPRAGLGALTLAALVWPLLAWLKVNQKVSAVTWAGRRLWFEGAWHGVYRALGGSLLLALGGVWLTALAWDRSLPVPWWAAAGAWAAWMVSMPFGLWAHLKYRQEHLRLGPFQMLWKVNRADFMQVVARTLAWSAMVGTVLAGVGAFALALMLVWARMRGTGGVSAGALSALGGVLALAWLVAVVPFARARATNLIWSKTGNRHMRLRSEIPVRAHTLLSLKLALRLLLTAGLYWPWAVVVLRRARMQSMQVWSRVDVDVLLAHWPTWQGDTAPVAVSPVSVMSDEAPSASTLQQHSGLHRVRA
ncbi:MAG: hypothetical protein RLZZ182_4 [Pseudomonadota bacterium]